MVVQAFAILMTRIPCVLLIFHFVNPLEPRPISSRYEVLHRNQWFRVWLIELSVQTMLGNNGQSWSNRTRPRGRFRICEFPRDIWWYREFAYRTKESFGRGQTRHSEESLGQARTEECVSD
jgi:hypothetical protein